VGLTEGLFFDFDVHFFHPISVPRHPEIKDSLCKLIMKQLGIAEGK
jgi:hypothetical protein